MSAPEYEVGKTYEITHVGIDGCRMRVLYVCAAPGVLHCMGIMGVERPADYPLTTSPEYRKLISMSGHEHNRRVAWVRMWGAIGAEHLARALASHPTRAQTARELADFEARRYAVACYALATTRAALEQDDEQ